MGRMSSEAAGTERFDASAAVSAAGQIGSSVDKHVVFRTIVVHHLRV